MVLAVAAAFAATACHDHDHDKPKPDPRLAESSHTLLLYLAGDNSLSNYLDTSVSNCVTGMLASDSALNLVVFKDNRNRLHSMPELFQLKFRDATHIDTVYIRQWSNDVNAVAPSFIADVVKTAFSQFDTEVKGLSFGSHGYSWYPSPIFSPEQSAATPRRAPAWFGQDDNNYTELWELHDALSEGPHLDYILFDACFMSGAEVAYEMRDVTDYILACPTEILAYGLPYNTVIPELATCQLKGNVTRALRGAFDAAVEKYADNSTFSLISTSGMEDLASAYSQLLAANAGRLDSLRRNAESLEPELQHYGRAASYSRYFFYDMLDVARWIDATDTSVKTAIDRVVLAEHHSDIFTDRDLSGKYSYTDAEKEAHDVPLTNCCGLSIGVPELFSLNQAYYSVGLIYRHDAESTLAAYANTEWGQQMGYAE